MRKLVNFAIKKIKSDDSYQLDKKLSLLGLLEIVMRRFLSLIHGFLKQLILLKKPRVWFVSREVRLIASSQLTALGPITFGRNTTIDAMSEEGIQFGKNVNVPEGCYFRCTGVVSHLGKGLKVGDNTGFGHYNFINAQGGVDIGNDVIIGPYVKILSENHKFEDCDTPIRMQGVSRKGITICSDVWIGANVTILDGVTIGEGAVIGAGSIVTKSIPAFSVAVGSPCKVVKSRK